MTTQAASSPWVTLRAWIKQPRVAGVLIIAYLLIAVGTLLSLDRGNLLFPLFSTLVFPPFVLSPLVILAAPIPNKFKYSLILLLLVIAMPMIGIYDSSYLELTIQICIFAGLALGLNIVVGFAGLLDLGYIAFFAVGAYVWAMFTSSADTVFFVSGIIVPGWAFYLFLFVGVVVAAGVGIVLGLPVLRLRGDYLAIVTLGFGEMIRVLARNADQPVNLTNGSQGLLNVASPPMPAFWVDFIGGIANTFGIQIAGNLEPLAQQILFYFIGIIILGVIIVAARRLDNSAIGRAWTAIREDEVAAIAMGVPLVRMKLLAFATGASFAGAIGVLYAAKQTFVSPESFSLIQSISILAMVIVGGMGGIRGVLLGSIIVTLLNLQVLKNMSLQLNALRNIDYVVPLINFHIKDWPTQLEPAKYERLVFGLLLILMMLFRPAGLLPEPRRKMELDEKRRTKTMETPIIKSSEPASGGD
ncbi:MAG: branched-chain amino acid ABC transporter permease [Chloroflexi bacterium]|uniref:branched-chain amino acid ABC transporter permease n=1 Tax=Candidatus Flexifilum breve TaxID=3140694 RepID=UPI003136F67D|nr:branched-chain amino acid ABC transporter permease [Chloroflexota bacterium]